MRVTMCLASVTQAYWYYVFTGTLRADKVYTGLDLGSREYQVM